MNSLARMTIYQDPPPDETPLSERILLVLQNDSIKTFSQLEVLCGIADPAWARNPEAFSDVLDRTLQGLIKEGKVLLVAKRPELCFRKGTVLDRIVRETDGGP